MKKFLFRSVMGIIVGGFFATLTTIVYIYFGEQSSIDGDIFLENSIGFFFLVWLITVTPLYFEIRSLRLSQQTALHFITVTILYLIFALGIGQISFNFKNILIYLIIDVIIYSIGWLSFYLYFKYECKKLNDDLEQIK